METIEPVIEMQPASIDVWAQKYQLKDKNGKVVDATIDDTFKRVARALADVEPEKKDYWYDEFLWAMRNGAIPAGRILSNAGAQDYKQSTSLINCTVSDTVYDSMDSILSKLHEAGMTLKAGCGAGYCFSTIRPRGAYVNGAGAYTSGPLSFMDIYDKMCFTVSSAGGRRGAQMATFDVGHPDVLEFIRAKREDGRLRQFNLSLLATDSFMEAVIHNLDWPLAFPLTPKEANQDNIDIYDSSKVLWRSWPTTEGYIVNDEGNVACRIYRTIKAQKLWDEIMRSTYDFAEPGIIFIDEVNKMNNNSWCEYVQASNPCVAQGTLVLTPNGFVPVEDLCYGDLIVTASGTAKPIIEIETHFDAMLYDVELSNGAKITVTKGHIFHSKKENKLHEPWDSHTRLKDLKEGDYLKIVCSDFRDTNIPKEQIEIPIPIKSITFSGKRGTAYDIYEKETDTWVTEYGIVSRGCGEQMLPPYGACLLGSIDLTKFVVNPFSDDAYFDFGPFEYVVAIFSRMLDNVVEINGLPLEQQRNELTRKRRHGMGYMGLGSALTMMKIKYGSPEAIKFTEELTFTMAHVGFQQGLALANEKGPAPIMREMFLENPKEFGKNLFCRSNYMKKLEAKDADLVHKLETYGSRYTHATSIAPCGTLALSVGNNISNGIEPSFAHQYSRNIIKEGKKTKEKVDVYSYEFLAYKTLVDPNATVDTLPDYFVTADSITPEQHVDMQAAAQKWIDSSLSKTVNCPSDYPYEKFKNLYMYAYEKGVKGLATFRFNPTRFQGVLVRNEDLANTTYQFTLADGSTVKAAGNEQIDYDGEIHTAANLFDAIKEGLYGKF